MRLYLATSTIFVALLLVGCSSATAREQHPQGEAFSKGAFVPDGGNLEEPPLPEGWERSDADGTVRQVSSSTYFGEGKEPHPAEKLVHPDHQHHQHDGHDHDHDHDHDGHQCIHDTPEIQRTFHSGMDMIAPQPRGSVDGPNGREFAVQAQGNIRIVIRTTDLYNGKYCQSSGGTSPDFKGSTVACTSDDVLTSAKRSILENNVLPAAVAVLQDALKVDRLTSNLVVPGNCAHHTIPSADKSTGVANADFVLYVSAGPTTGSTLAWAGYCYLNSYPGRPIVGRANFGPKHLAWDSAGVDAPDNQKKIRTAVHEILHALGFTKTYYENYWTGYSSTSQIYQDTTSLRGGAPIRLLKSPKVLAEAKSYFGCTTAPGAELEWGEGSQGSHWNRRSFFQEVMSPVVGDSIYSKFTYAFLEDSGYYYPVYSEAETTMAWGKDAGCGFLTDKCNTVAGGKDQFFCFSTSSSAKMCDWNQRGIGTCQVGTYGSALPSYWAYFSDNTKGGTANYFDKCPMVQAYSNRICGKAETPSTYFTAYGYYFGDGGRCFEVSTPFVQTAYNGNNDGTPARCFKARCNQGTQVQFKVGAGESGGLETDWIDCPSSGAGGSTITMTGNYGSKWIGTVTCPPASVVCSSDIYHGPATTPAPAGPQPPTPAPVPPTPNPPTPVPTTTTAAPAGPCQSNNHLSGSSPSSVLSVAAINDILDEHNKARISVDPDAATMPMVKWNQALANHAQNWINSCPGMSHSSTASRQNVAGFSYVGENLGAGYGGNSYDVNNGGKTVTMAWNNEVQYWTYNKINNGDCQSGQVCGHYTQNIWAATTDIGCGYKYCGSLTYKNYWVCLYGPGGNYQNQYPYTQVTGGGTPAGGTCAPTPATPAPTARQCTNAADCNGHASSVSGVEGSCSCTCSTGFTGSTCNTCASGYTSYPNCYRLCTVSADCSNHASSVSGNANSGCSCTCSTGFTGSSCNTCASGYTSYPNCYRLCTTSTDCTGHASSASGNVNSGCSCTCSTGFTGSTCNTCASGYTSYPNCYRICTTSTDCNSHASAVSGNANSGCSCTCSTGFTGSSCNTCASGYTSYPNCYRLCTTSTDCSGHASSVSGNVNSGCSCSCSTGFTGSSCNTCASGYTNYPNCYRLCTTSSDCSGHASAVSGNVNSGCSCTCSTGFTGSSCNTCASGYESYPNCHRTCTTSTDCSGHASAVTGNVDSGCSCTCSTGFTGSTCATCASGYTNYPNCYRLCTTSSDCSGHASAVSGNANSGCSCTCNTKYTGASCNQCASGYTNYPSCYALCTVSGNCNNHATAVSGDVNSGCSCTCSSKFAGAACDSCAAAYESYPNCYLSCTSAANCNNRATSVSGNTNGGCTCTCRNQWSGSSCNVCDSKFDQTDDCGSCATGYSGYPNCKRDCTSSQDCNGHASSVTGTAGSCTCTCRNQWSGSTCNTCASKFDSSNDCGTCATGRDTYPQCYVTCTSAADCNGRASAVSGNTNTGCTCTCRNQWSGSSCSTCPSGFNSSKDCGECATGFGGYPTCKRLCTVSTDCSGHATTVSGVEGNCQCTCRNQWSGNNCGTCESHYDSSNDCASCASGYTGYPSCGLQLCTNADDCSGHASSVSGNKGSCTCTCANAWTGSTCQTCPAAFTGPNCDTCASGYTGYPNCKRVCTLATDCSGNAASVSGVEGSCSCTCKTGFTGSSCNTCASGHDSYPSCYLSCTVAANCSGHATAVSGNSNTGCTCTCRNQWSGSSCGTCSSEFDSSNDCGSCATGYTGYPNCKRVCTATTDCSGHATTVTGTAGSCSCTCRNQWSGSTCATCDSKYNASEDCGVCADGKGGYPTCSGLCTISGDCSNHATAVSGTTSSGCSCTCRNSWTGSTCQTCPANISSTSDCGACISGHGGYPNCKRMCTVQADCSGNAQEVTGLEGSCQCACKTGFTGAACDQCASGYSGSNCLRTCTSATDCSGRATSVSGTAGSCSCTCRNQWTGSSCDTCASKFNAGLDCGACASGYDTYPNCYATCTTGGNCSGNAAGVTGNSNTGCTCSCSNAWTGSACETCPTGFDASASCGACASGFGGYPNCKRLCSMASDCSNNAASVSGVEGSCACTCKAGFSGASCNACAAGFDSYPNCALSCTVAANCSNHATAVSGNSNAGCNCTCRNSWLGDSCQTCAAKHDSSNDCGSCATGYSIYPTCKRTCTVAADCNNHASAVSGTEGDCTCTCRNQWKGGEGVDSSDDSACNVCPSKFDSSKDCGACASGYTGYPNCHQLCTVAANCNGNAVQVSGDVTNGCTCTCRNAWMGSDCSICPSGTNSSADCAACSSGYGSYPNCKALCTVAADCSGNANSVSGVKGSCSCTCANQWTGATCDTCPSKYNASTNCATCAAGRDSYPGCYESCTIAANCSSHATAVSGNTNTGCQCTCRNRWSGASCATCDSHYDASKDCGACASGYTGYPNCGLDLCTNAADCNGHATSVSGNRGSCTCNCANGWTGATCDTCPSKYNASANCATCAAGYDSYPTCALACTIAANCSSHATAVSGNSNTGCQCTCRNQWSGASCYTCGSQFNSSQDCATCASGYGNYPSCKAACTVSTDCSGNADSVSGFEGGCQCSCKTGFGGAKCDQCASSYDSYPNCYRQCTLAANCSGNAAQVSGNSNTGCTCTCRNQWSGATCGTCPANFNSTVDCATCASGYTNYPTCGGVCTSATDCNNHAFQVSGFVGNCSCSCRNKWQGATCNTCPMHFDSSNDCGSCAAGYDSYPSCYLSCTSADNCSSHATAVSGNGNTGCQCTCRNLWSGSTCQSCPANVSTADDCGSCNAGYDGYPNCKRKCNATVDCGSNAASASGLEGSCQCTCKSGYVGAKCDQCANGFTMVGATCERLCTASSDCTGNAITVAGNVKEGCACTCRNQWAGSACSSCNTKFDSTNDCGACAAGFDSYPACTLIVTTASTTTTEAPSTSTTTTEGAVTTTSTTAPALTTTTTGAPVQTTTTTTDVPTDVSTTTTTEAPVVVTTTSTDAPVVTTTSTTTTTEAPAVTTTTTEVASTTSAPRETTTTVAPVATTTSEAPAVTTTTTTEAPIGTTTTTTTEGSVATTTTTEAPAVSTTTSTEAPVASTTTTEAVIDTTTTTTTSEAVITTSETTTTSTTTAETTTTEGPRETTTTEVPAVTTTSTDAPVATTTTTTTPTEAPAVTSTSTTSAPRETTTTTTVAPVATTASEAPAVTTTTTTEAPIGTTTTTTTEGSVVTTTTTEAPAVSTTTSTEAPVASTTTTTTEAVIDTTTTTTSEAVTTTSETAAETTTTSTTTAAAAETTTTTANATPLSTTTTTAAPVLTTTQPPTTTDVSPTIVTGFKANFDVSSGAPTDKEQFAETLAKKLTTVLGKNVDAKEIDVTEFDTTTGQVQFSFVGTNAAEITSEASAVANKDQGAAFGLTGMAAETAPSPAAATDSTDDGAQTSLIVGIVAGVLLLTLIVAVIVGVFRKRGEAGKSRPSFENYNGLDGNLENDGELAPMVASSPTAGALSPGFEQESATTSGSPRLPPRKMKVPDSAGFFEQEEPILPQREANDAGTGRINASDVDEWL